MITAQQATMITANQKGKNPLLGPSGPHPKPRRTASRRTIPPSNISTEAVTTSAARILLLQQAAFFHQVAVEFFILLHPFDVLRASGERRLQRAIFEILFEVRRLVDFLEKAGVPFNRVLGHIWRAENASQHQLVDIDTHGLFDRRNRLPISPWNACRIEDGKRADAICFPMAHALNGVVYGGIDVLSHQIDANLTPAFEWYVTKF